MTAAAARAGRLIGGTLLLAVLTCPAAAQSDGSAQAAIRSALTQWMADFNAGDAEQACRLFALDLIAQVRGQPERSYSDLCQLLKRSLSDQTRSYKYDLAIKEVLVAGDLAVVRLTWTLAVRRKDTGDETRSMSTASTSSAANATAAGR